MDKKEVIQTLGEMREAADYFPTDGKYLKAIEYAMNYLDNVEEGAKFAVQPIVSQGGGSEAEAGVLNAVFSIEYGQMCLRTETGWLLWSESQPCGDTLSDIIYYANKVYRGKLRRSKSG